MGWQPETQPKGKPPKIIYLCDREKECNKHEECGRLCKHTADIMHAVNFINLGDGNYVEERPTIDAEPHWIPCSERLPEYNDVVLVSYYSDIAKMGNEESPVFRRIYETYENGLSSMDGETYRRLMIMPEVTMLWYYPEEKQWSFPDGSDLPEYMTITAWLPIPEPYEVEDEETD